MSELTLSLRITADGRVVANELQRAQGAVQSFGEAAERGGEKASKSFGRSRRGVESISKSLQQMQTVALAAFAALSSGRMLGALTRELAGFDESMSAVRAVTQASDADMQRLTATARELGASTRFSAREAAEGVRFFGVAGYDTTQIIQALPAALDLATVAQIDLGRSADLTSNILASFNLHTAETARVADVLAVASSNANTDVEQLAEALKPVGGVARSLNISLEETSAVLGAMAQAGRQSGEAGTGLRAILSQLLNLTPASTQVLKDLGLTAADVDLETRSLTEVLHTLADAGIGAGQAFTIFGQRGAPALMDVLGQLPELDRLSGVMDDVTSASRRMAGVMDDNLRGDLVSLRSALAELTQMLGDAGLLAAMRGTVQGVTLLTRALGGNQEALDKLGPVLGVVIDAMTLLAGVVTARLVSALAAQSAAALVSVGSLNALNISLVAATLQMRALTVAAGVARAALALVGGPVGLVVLGLTAAVIAARRYRASLASMGTESEEAAAALTALRKIAAEGWQTDRLDEVREHINTLREQADEAADALEELVKKSRRIGNISGIDHGPTERQQEAIDKQEQLVERLREQARLAEHLAGERHYEDIANGMGLMQHAGEAAAGVMERLGLVTRNAAGGFGEMAEASAELVDPLTEQVEQLQEMLIELTAGEDALLNYHQAQALAAAAQEDAANGTTRNTEAVMRHFEALRTLRAQIADARASQEQATQADLANAQARQEQAQQARNLAGTYRELMSTVNPLAAQQAKLNEQLASMTQLASLGVDELEALGVDAELLGEIIQALADELDGLGRASDVDTFFGLDFDELFDQLKKAQQEMQEIAEIEWSFDHLIDSFHPLAQQMRRMGDEIALIDEALSRGLITNAEAGFFKMGAMADNVFSAMMQGVDQSSSAYKKLEVAQQAVNVALGIAAILQQGTGDPYTAVSRMIAMAAMVSQLVDGIGSLSGGARRSEDRQKTQGTGTVLGDPKAQSESIQKALDITADATSQLVGINRGMLRALQELKSGITGASGFLARGAGEFEVDLSGMGSDALGKLLGGLFGPLGLGKLLGGYAKVVDSGVQIVGGTLSDMIDDVMVRAFQEVKEKKNIFRSSKYKIYTGDLDEGFARQFQLIFQSIADTVSAGAAALGISAEEVERAMSAFRVQEQLISLEDMSAEEQAAALEAVFSQIFDDLALTVIPYIGQFQEIGEGLGETLVRVATSVQVMQEAIKRLNLSLDETDPERMAQISVSLIDALGGIEAFITAMESFREKFAPASHLLAVASDELARAFDAVGLSVPATRDEMWALMSTLDASTEAGRQQIAVLLELTDAADAYYKHLEQVQSEREGLERRLLELNGDTAALRALELAALDESNRALQQRIWALEDEMAAERALADLMEGVVNDIASLSLSPLRARWRELTLAHQEAMAAALELGASEEQLSAIRARHALQLMQLAASLEESLLSAWDQLTGAAADSFGGGMGGGMAGAVGNAADNMRDAIVRALEGVQEWLRRSSFEDPSLTPLSKLTAMQTEFDRLVEIALTGSGQEQIDAINALPQLASQLEALGVQVYGSATEPFQDFRAALLEAMQQVMEIDVPAEQGGPVTGAQVGQIGSSVDQVAQHNREQVALAARMLEELGTLAAISGSTAPEVAERLGLELGTIIEALIGETERGTLETVEQLIAVANTLGMDLAEVADAIGLHVGALTDQESLMGQALEAAVLRMPMEIQEELWGPLDRVWQATTEADANAAIADLLSATRSLPVEYQNALAPFFEELDVQDLELVQIGLLDNINSILAASAGTLAAIQQLLHAQKELDFDDQWLPKEPTPPPPPKFATGGWASGIIETGDGGGPELVLPHDVSRFFARAGVPINAPTDPRVVERLDQLIQLEREALEQRGEIGQRQHEATAAMASSMDELAREERSAAGMNR